MIPALAFALLLALALYANRRLHWDVDPGGYPDGPRTVAPFPDKAVHLCVAVALTLAACVVGVPPALAAGLVIAAAIAFEYTQGYVSWWDAGAGVAGALAAALLWAVAR